MTHATTCSLIAFVLFMLATCSAVAEDLYVISGQVTYAGAGVSSVTMGGLPGTPVTDSSGNYSAEVPWGWSGTVTPSKPGYTFSPTSREYAKVTSNQSGQDYTGALLTCSISGWVYGVEAPGGVVSGAIMNGLPGPPITNGLGYYYVLVPWGWSGTVMPWKPGYVFTPITYSSVTTNQYFQDYLGRRDIDFALISADFSPEAPTGAQPGSVLASSWTTTGPASSKEFWCEFLPSKTGGFDIARFGGTITNSYLAVHLLEGTQTYSPTQTLNWLPDGIYTVVSMVNRPGTSQLYELSYLDNWAPIAGRRLRIRNTQAPVCDLVLENPQFTWNGQLVSFSCTVRNVGPSASPPYGFWIEAAQGSLSAEGLFTPNGYLGEGSRVAELAPNATFNYRRNNMQTVGSSPVVAIMVDSTDLVPETNEQNNWAWSGTPPGPCGSAIDLTIVDASIDSGQLAPVELDSAGNLNWSCEVRNFSDVDSGPVWIELFASQTGGLDSLRSGITLTKSEKIDVPASTTQSFDFSQQLEGIPDGIYSVVAVVNRCGVGDNPGDIWPMYEYDGVLSFDNLFHLPGRVVLRNMTSATANLEWQTAPTVVRNGNTIDFAGTVINSGSGTSGPFWTELFYGTVDTAGIFSKVGQIGGGQHCAGLSEGTTTTIGLTGSVPNGTWVIGFITDSTDLVPESDETDNWDLMTP